VWAYQRVCLKLIGGGKMSKKIHHQKWRPGELVIFRKIPERLPTKEYRNLRKTREKANSSIARMMLD
jgi:hypothetical protein